VSHVGSCAHGDAVRTSDIDIDAGGHLPPLLSVEIKDQLEESTVPYFVDVVDLASVDAKYCHELLDGAVAASNMTNDPNLTVHTYNEELALDVSRD
jgi:predicted nucleotidyltransferase